MHGRDSDGALQAGQLVYQVGDFLKFFRTLAIQKISPYPSFSKRGIGSGRGGGNNQINNL